MLNRNIWYVIYQTVPWKPAGKPLYDPDLEDFYDGAACDFCGECLAVCPELGGRIGDPRATWRRLAAGEYVREVLDRCSSCMTCTVVCPKGCNPYGLILYRWHERERARGLPMRASLVMPLEPGNAWHGVMEGLPPEEKAMLDEWSDLRRPELSGNALFAGCNLQILPYMASSSMFEGLPIFGRPDLCCGEVYYRMGVFDKVKSVAEHLERTYAETGITELVAYCQACYNVLANILPSRFGAEFPFKVSYFGDMLAERVLSGELPVAGRLKGLRVTVQDPCHSKLLGRDFQQRPRRILEYMGCEVVEMPHAFEMSLCCGLGHGAARYSPIDMAFGIARRLREARSTRAEYLVVYCNSCDLLFSVGTQVTPFIIPVYHLNELVARALGEPLPRRNLKRARSMMSQLFLKGAPKVLSPRRFRVENPG
jgi:Fe-S oxidoreductase